MTRCNCDGGGIGVCMCSHRRGYAGLSDAAAKETAIRALGRTGAKLTVEADDDCKIVRLTEEGHTGVAVQVWVYLMDEEQS